MTITRNETRHQFTRGAEIMRHEYGLYFSALFFSFMIAFLTSLGTWVFSANAALSEDEGTIALGRIVAEFNVKTGKPTDKVKMEFKRGEGKKIFVMPADKLLEALATLSMSLTMRSQRGTRNVSRCSSRFLFIGRDAGVTDQHGGVFRKLRRFRLQLFLAVNRLKCRPGSFRMQVATVRNRWHHPVVRMPDPGLHFAVSDKFIQRLRIVGAGARGEDVHGCRRGRVRQYCSGQGTGCWKVVAHPLQKPASVPGQPVEQQFVGVILKRYPVFSGDHQPDFLHASHASFVDAEGGHRQQVYALD